MLVSADKSYSHQTLSCIKYTTIEQYWYYNCTLYQDNPKIVITPIFFLVHGICCRFYLVQNGSEFVESNLREKNTFFCETKWFLKINDFLIYTSFYHWPLSAQEKQHHSSFTLLLRGNGSFIFLSTWEKSQHLPLHFSLTGITIDNYFLLICSEDFGKKSAC